MKLLAMTAAVAVGVTTFSTNGEARIRCEGGFQVVSGQGQIATPYCEDEYLATVARGYGIRVSGAAIRRNPHRKEEVCKAIGHDGRIYDACLKYRNDNGGRFTR